jgi:hypothetical protein
VVESEAVRWPLVHRDDLAELYALALEIAPPSSSYIGAVIDGLEVGRIARGFGLPNQATRVISADQVAAELGAWARGYARDERLSGAKARAELGWRPKRLDPEGEIAGLPQNPSEEEIGAGEALRTEMNVRHFHRLCNSLSQARTTKCSANPEFVGRNVIPAFGRCDSVLKSCDGRDSFLTDRV